MTALSLIQALIPSTANSKSGTLPFSGDGTPEDGASPFSLLVPGNGEQSTTSELDVTGAAANDGAAQSAVENPSTSLLDILSGAQPTNVKDPDLLVASNSNGAPEVPAAPAVDPATVVPTGPETGDVPAGVATDGTVQKGQAASAEGTAATAPQAPVVGGAATASSASAATAEQAAAVKPAAPQAQAAQVAAAPEAATNQATPALQARGDVLEGGQGAPAAQKLLGITDPKNVSESAQRDPAVSTFAAGNAQKNTFAANAANGSSQQQFGATAGTQTGNQPAFHEVSSQQLQQENSAQRLPQQAAPPPAQPRFDVPVQATAAADTASTQAAQSDGALLADQRPPVTVTVRFDQTIQGPQLAAQQLAFHIRRNFANGVNRFEVRLDPPELGRIDVRLDMGSDGRVAAALTVDRPETLDLLQRDARLLQKALEEAGINVDDSALNFSLRDGDGRTGGDDGESGGLAGQSAHGDGLEDGPSAMASLEPVAIIENDRVDIRV